MLLHNRIRKVAQSPITHGSFWLGLEKVLLGLKGLALALLSTNLLSPEIYGSYQYILSLLGLFAVTSLPGMGTAIVRAEAQQRNETLARSISAMLLWSLLGSIGLLFLAVQNTLANHQEVAQAMFGIAILFPLYTVAPTWRYVFLGRELYKRSFQASLWIESVSLITTIIAIIVSGKLGALLLGSIGVSTVMAMILILPLYKTSRRQLSTQKLESDIKYGKNLSSSYAVVAATNFLDKVLVGHFLGLTELATYSVASMIPEQLKAILSVSSTTLLPHFSKQEYDDSAKKRLLRWFVVATGILSLGIAAYCAVSPHIFAFAFRQYLSAVPYNQLLALGLLAIPLQTLDSFFRGQQAEQVILKSTLFTSITSLVLQAVLVPSFGIWGAVAARLGGQFGNALVLLHYFLRDKRSFAKTSARDGRETNQNSVA